MSKSKIIKSHKISSTIHAARQTMLLVIYKGEWYHSRFASRWLPPRLSDRTLSSLQYNLSTNLDPPVSQWGSISMRICHQKYRLRVELTVNPGPPAKKYLNGGNITSHRLESMKVPSFHWAKKFRLKANIARKDDFRIKKRTYPTPSGYRLHLHDPSQKNHQYFGICTICELKCLYTHAHKTCTEDRQVQNWC